MNTNDGFFKSYKNNLRSKENYSKLSFLRRKSYTIILGFQKYVIFKNLICR